MTRYILMTCVLVHYMGLLMGISRGQILRNQPDLFLYATDNISIMGNQIVGYMIEHRDGESTHVDGPLIHDIVEYLKK